jgi:hypothetical protein
VAQITDIQQRVLDRLEDTGVFWNIQDELRPLIVEAMNAATLITGEPQKRATTLYNIPANPNPTGFTPLALPGDALAITRIDASGQSLDKYLVWDLDRHYPGWELQTAPSVQAWFPFGLTKFGVWPQPTAGQQVRLSYIAFPAPYTRPYPMNATIPFQDEYLDGLSDWAAGIARLKEGGPDWEQAREVLNRFFAKMEELSRFVYRKNTLRFTRTFGAPAKINEVSTR